MILRENGSGFCGPGPFFVLNALVDDISDKSDERRWQLLNLKRNEFNIAQAFALFRRRGIEPILIKGWASARFYPKPHERYYGDIDVAVAAGDFDAALAVLSDNKTAALGIDLHHELRGLDTVPWDIIFANSELADMEGEAIRVLCPEDHLRVAAVHWLIDGGELKHRLWDIYYAVDRRPGSFDWKKCLDVVSATRRRWIVLTVGLAHRYLGLYIEDLPFAREAKALPSWLTDTVEKQWKSGVRLRPLHTCLRDPGALFSQIRKRIPPNPIQATVNMEGEFDDGSRLRYQARDIFRRAVPSAGRIVKTLIGR